ncbi:MAG: MGMT family protein [Clostridiales bacterium]|jgi:alkylated DNA nucleotide flippase Atl1|nr:MGMT family protein [Clostridiales bacterium]
MATERPLTNQVLETKNEGPRYEETSQGIKVILPAWEIEKAIKLIPIGRIVTLDALRTYLAFRNRAFYTDVSSTISALRLIAAANEEREGEFPVPYWRVIKANGSLLDDMPGGDGVQKQRLEEEGHVILGIEDDYYLRDFTNHAKQFNFLG